jgi:GNAT superfamily N-acetyltransferase
MPKVQRKDIPRALLEHLLQRINQRSIDAQALKSLAIWLDTNPEVPAGPLYQAVGLLRRG